MEDRRYVKFTTLIIGMIIFITPIFAFGYDDKTTHPALTGEIVNLFNHYYPDFKISDSEKVLIKKGSTDEDIPPRWMQHFYDPVYNRGLVLGIEWEKSKDWSQDILAQAKYDPIFVASLGTITRKLFSSGTDYSWERAIYEYAWGNKERGLESLGHILHLLEDATVPEHTRNDAHLPVFGMGSPYEDWTSQFNDKNLNLSDKLTKENEKPIIFSNLNQYFDINAVYSNNNFFSRDTILNEKYNKPAVIKEKKEILSDGILYIFGLGNFDSNDFHLVQIKSKIDPKTGENKKIYSLDDFDNLILTDYWNFLSRQAVLSGVGVVKLFFDEVAKEKQSKILLSRNTSFLEQSINKLAAMGNSIQTAAIGAWKELTGNGQSAIIVQSLPSAETVSSSGGAPNPSTALTLSSNSSAQENDSSQIVAEAQFPEYSPFPSVPLAPSYNPSPNNFTPSLPYPGFGGGGSPVSPQSQVLSSASSDIATTTTATSSAITSASSVVGVVLPVVINEVAWMGSVVSEVDSNKWQYYEWIELYNKGSDRVDFAGWILSIEGKKDIVLKNTIPANGYYFIERSGYHAFNDISADIATSFGAGLANSGAMLVLKDALGQEVDRVDGSDNWKIGGGEIIGNNTTKETAQRSGSFWITATATPKAVNFTPPSLPDTTPPDISFSISECEHSLSPDSNNCLLTASTTLHLSWQSSADDLDYFKLTIAGQISTTTATSTIVAVQDNASSTFNVMAIDKSGNSSELKTISVEISTIPVVINEVAWAGTAASTDEDEWIELYNRTSKTINLNNWVLHSQTDGKPYINLSKSIPGKGYYLLERTDDTTVSSTTTDLIYTGALSNGGEILVLSYASTTIDQTVLCGNGPVEWCPGFDYKYRTMERIDYDITGTDPDNWSYNNMLIQNGKNADGQPINGTPKARNSANYLIANGLSYISGNINLTKSRSPYFVNNPSQVFQDNSTLTIEPGVVIKFYNNAGFSFAGNAKIIAQGAAGDDKQIVFTSFWDDEYGGDTNNDATTTHPSPGDWFGVTIIGQSGRERSIFDHTIFRYGGQYYSNMAQGRANLSVQNVLATITNSTFENSRIYGLRLDNSNSVVSGNVFRFNNRGHDSAGYNSALLVLEGNPTISNNTFSGNAIGLALYDSPAIVSGNYFASSSIAAIYSFGRLPVFTKNSGANNALNAINIWGNLTRKNDAVSLVSNPLPYFLKGYETPTVVSSSTLNIERGVVIKNADSVINVYGNLVINGEKPEDIIFTSLYDDSAGGDTNNDAGASSPSPGQFPGIYVSSTGSLKARGFTMRYAGNLYYGGNNAAGVMTDGGVLDIANALFSSNYPYGIYAVNSKNIKIENARFENHNYSGTWGLKAALGFEQAAVILTNVSFINNILDVFSYMSTFVASDINFLDNNATTSPPGLWQ